MNSLNKNTPTCALTDIIKRPLSFAEREYLRRLAKDTKKARIALHK